MLMKIHENDREFVFIDDPEPCFFRKYLKLRSKSSEQEFIPSYFWLLVKYIFWHCQLSVQESDSGGYGLVFHLVTASKIN